MMSRTILVLLLLTVIIFSIIPNKILHSQTIGFQSNLEKDKDDAKLSIKPWGRIKYMAIESNNTIGITDAGSRLGLNVLQEMNNDITLFGGIELSVFLSSNGGFQLSPDNSNTTGFLNVIDVTNGNIFGLRKGYIGADFMEYGTVSIGKQYSAYYEVAGLTDISENNSGYASFVYSPDGTDGGASGTGRASNSVLYKNTFGNLKVALSGQFKLSEKRFSRVVNSISGSVLYKLPLNISAGMAYNGVFLDPDLGGRIRGLNENPFYSAIGINYSTDKLFFGFTYAYEENGDIAKVNDSTVVFSGYGIELSAMWKPYKNWNILCGVNYQHPKNVDELINKNFNRLVYFYGLQYSALSNVLFFLEGAIDNSVTPEGGGIKNNVSAGIKFDFR